MFIFTSLINCYLSICSPIYSTVDFWHLQCLSCVDCAEDTSEDNSAFFGYFAVTWSYAAKNIDSSKSRLKYL